MEDVSIDRRVRRTRARLHDAVVELVADKGYQAVTVEHILERADVTRATFYTHFRDKEHLLASVADELVDECLAAYEAAPHVPDDPGGHRLAVLFRRARSEGTAWRVILRGEGDGAALRRLRTRLADIVRASIAANVHTLGSRPVVPEALVVEMTVGEILTVLAWWVEAEGTEDDPAHDDPDAVVDWLRATALYGRLWALGVTDTVLASSGAAGYRAALPARDRRPHKLRPPRKEQSTA
jgi:AcrR family transcriptional regulator